MEGEWRLFVLDALYFLPPERLSRINEENWLTERISDDPKFLQLDSHNVRRLIPALKALSVRFSQIDCREEDISLAREVCLENLYVLNLSMLKTAMAVFWNTPPAEAESRGYTHILRHPGEPLSLRILGNMDVYADAIPHESDSRLSDSEEAVIDFLNRESLSEPYKEEYIQRSDTALPDINTIASRALWPELIGSQAVLVNEKLSLERYQTALAGMTFSYKKFLFHGIPDERMKIVLELGIVPVTIENIAVIREDYPRLWNDFVLSKDADDLTKLMDTDEVQLTESELASLLEDARMKDSVAENMLFIFSKTVSLRNRKFSTPVLARIVAAHLAPDDLPFLLKSFTQEPLTVRSAFLDYTATHADSIADAAEQAQFVPVEVYAVCLNKLTEAGLLSCGLTWRTRILRSYALKIRSPNSPIHRKYG